MKKVLAILPLMTAVFLAPSCKITIGGDDTSFTYEATATKGTNTATIRIKWNSGANLSFDSDTLKFSFSTPEAEKAEFEDPSSTMSPKVVKVTFKGNLEEEVTGKIDFSYTNIKTGASCAIQNDVTISVTENN